MKYYKWILAIVWIGLSPLFGEAYYRFFHDRMLEMGSSRAMVEFWPFATAAALVVAVVMLISDLPGRRG